MTYAFWSGLKFFCEVDASKTQIATLPLWLTSQTAERLLLILFESGT